MSDDGGLVPESKSDLTRARAAERAGYPAITPVVNDLLEWLRDGNWPVAHVLAPFLRDLGPVPPLVGGIRSILEGATTYLAHHGGCEYRKGLQSLGLGGCEETC